MTVEQEAPDTAIQARLEEMERRLHEVWAVASRAPAPGVVKAQRSLEAMGTAVEDLHVAAREVASVARRVGEEQRRYEQLFQLAPNGYLVTDQRTVIEEANEAAALLLHRDPGEVIGESLPDFVPEQRERISALQDSARADPGRVAVADDLTVTLAGAPVRLSVRCRAMCDSEEHVVGFGWAIDERSDRQEAERVAREAQKAETARYRELAQHWERLEGAKSDFLHLTSHELRSPLTVLGGYLSMLDAGTYGELSEPVERVVDLLVAKTHELNELVNDMLETARLDGDQLGVRRIRVEVGDVVGQVVDDWRPLTRPGQQLIFAQPAESVFVDADPARLRTIVTNLVGNAIKYSPDGGDVTCTVGRNADQAFISVADRGLGIAAESLDMLFTRFGRVVTPATSRIPGTGLGLYIARELARIHDGDITVQSQPGQSSTFTVALPLRSDHDGDGVASPAS